MINHEFNWLNINIEIVMVEENEGEALTKEEEAKCFEAFSAFDKDSSGKIDANELRIVLEMMG